MQIEGKDSHLLKILVGKSSMVDSVLEQSEKYKVQILYTQIERDSTNYPTFQSFAYQVNTDKYFYPASSVKFPAAVLALEKLNHLNVPGLDRNTPLKIDSAYAGQTAVTHDSTAPDHLPSIGHYIKKIFLVSDNDAYNRLYEFLGQQYIHETFKEKGYHGIALIRRLEKALAPEQNRATNPFIFYLGDRNIYAQPLVIHDKDYRIKMDEIRQGRGYYKNNEFIAEPMDFSYSNYFAISTQQEIMQAIIFPDAVDLKKRFDLTPDDYQFLYRYMSILPRESEIEMYRDTTQYYDGYVKLFIYGDSKERIPSHIRIFSKSGQAYGYLQDNAYIIDLENNIEFFLSAVLQVNENQIYNDDIYEYDEIGFPFLADLGRIIYQHEINRKRKNRPDLSRFQVH
jgi:hypothetical protein